MRLKKIKIQSRKGSVRSFDGQATLEFIFCFIMLLLLVYGCIMAFKWSGRGLAERRIAHDESLVEGRIGIFDEDWDSYDESPASQVWPEFYNTPKMKLIFNQWD